MPATARKDSTAKRAQTLVDQLSAVLRQPADSPSEPLIVENLIAQTKSAHVQAIWDAWKDLSPDERSQIILDAYANAKRLRGLTITVAMGLTDEEALWGGFLPYSIVTTRRREDGVSLHQLERALASAGGIVIKVGSSTQLRFATMEQAQDAYRRLAQAVPGPYWAIVQEQAPAA